MQTVTCFLSTMVLVVWQSFLLPVLAHAQALPVRPAADSGVVIGPDGGERRDLTENRFMLFKVGPMLTGSRQLFMGVEHMPPGSAIPVHQHHRDEEILFVHEGDVTVTLNGRSSRAPRGATVYFPPGVWVGVQNTGSEAAVVLFIFAEPLVEHCFRTGGKQLSAAEATVRDRACEMTFR